MMSDKAKKLIKDIAGWVIYLAFLAGLVYGIPKGLAYVLKTPYPMAAITSGSMWPALKRGDLVLIKGVSAKNEIKVGDIIVYRNQIGFTIHRVIEMREDTVITKGDANNVADSPVRYEEIVGKALSFGNGKVVKIPSLGSISILVNKVKM